MVISQVDWTLGDGGPGDGAITVGLQQPGAASGTCRQRPLACVLSPYFLLAVCIYIF